MAAKVRLDLALVERGLVESRSGAQRLILAGEVKVDGHVVDKASAKVGPEAELVLKSKPPFVSRAGGKLAGALDGFGVEVRGRVCLDVGASTGGFTDCLLQRGAARVFCFDVGTNQLVWKIRSDERVVARERFNCRHLAPEDVAEVPSLGVVDVSFISLTLILPRMMEVVEPGGEIVALVKPQFEAPREAIGKGGIVRDEATREAAVQRVRRCVLERGGEWRGVLDSEVVGGDGNRELLGWIGVGRQ